MRLEGVPAGAQQRRAPTRFPGAWKPRIAVFKSFSFSNYSGITWTNEWLICYLTVYCATLLTKDTFHQWNFDQLTFFDLSMTASCSSKAADLLCESIAKIEITAIYSVKSGWLLLSLATTEHHMVQTHLYWEALKIHAWAFAERLYKPITMNLWSLDIPRDKTWCRPVYCIHACTSYFHHVISVLCTVQCTVVPPILNYCWLNEIEKNWLERKYARTKSYHISF